MYASVALLRLEISTEISPECYWQRLEHRFPTAMGYTPVLWLVFYFSLSSSNLRLFNPSTAPFFSLKILFFTFLSTLPPLPIFCSTYYLFQQLEIVLFSLPPLLHFFTIKQSLLSTCLSYFLQSTFIRFSPCYIEGTFRYFLGS